ncbi:MAG: PilZ domain-containing protein [Candidatus Omnitrophica bacterium]|nr:PilZ domain-containing protein [Candidatus Omnitrophota bacterium]
MGLFVVILILSILLLILAALFVHEKQAKSAKSPIGRMTEYWDGPERRQSRRVRAILPAKYSIDHKPRPKKESKSKNISTGGILIQLNEKVLPATQLLLDIILPEDRKPVTARGEVVWINDLPETDETGRRLFDAGIKFTSMSPSDKERLNKHIEDIP